MGDGFLLWVGTTTMVRLPRSPGVTVNSEWPHDQETQFLISSLLRVYRHRIEINPTNFSMSPLVEDNRNTFGVKYVPFNIAYVSW